MNVLLQILRLLAAIALAFIYADMDSRLHRIVHIYHEADHPGFEMVMEWGETNESLDTAIQLTRMCGQLCVGAYHTGEKRLVDVQQLNIKAIDMLSVHPREANLTDTGARNAAEMLGRGTWNYKNVPTMIYPMNRFD